MKKINFLLMLLMLAFATQALAWKPIMIGHRGCRQGVENTEEAFINGATKYGFQALECDVKVTSDKKYVCWHDDVITKCSPNCTIYNNTLATIQSKTLTQTRSGTTYTGKICTVDRYLEICKTYNVIPVVELKYAVGINGNDMSNFPGLYALIEKHGLVDKTIILTSMTGALTYVRKNYPKLKCQYLVNYITDNNVSWAKTNGCDISTCYYYSSTSGQYLTQALMDKAKAAGLKVSIWTVNSETDYKKYAGYGANYVTSDDLKRANIADLPGTDPNPVEADVTWVLNGGTVSGTLPTTITSTYTIPTPTKTGYVFLGWYSTNSTSGTKYTTLSAGFKGTVYAVWRETKVTWVLNGGKVYEEQAAVPSNEELMETFKADYNTYFGQSIATTREFSNFLYYGNSIGCDVSKMMTDSKSGWKWLGDYINTVSSAAGVTMSAEVNWRYSINAFFTCGAAGNYNADFSTAGQPTKWASAYQTAHGNTSGGATTLVEVSLPTRFSSTYTIPTPVKDGYDFVGWYNNANGTGTALTTLPAYYDGTVYAIWKLNDADVIWQLNGGTTTATLPTKITSTYTLPTPTKTGYVFVGWYDNANGTGTALTTLPVGYKGTVYAIWREAKVTWVLNGGKVYEEKTTGATVVVPTNDSLWTAFKAYYKTFYNENRADQPITAVATFMTKGYKILTDATSEYKWLGDYINSVATAQGYTLGEEEANWRWHADAFFQANQHTSWPQTADFTEAGKPAKWGAAYQAAHGGSATGGTTTKVEVTLPTKITSTYTIPTPEKEGSTFVGWYDNANGTGTALKTLPAYYDGTVYAIWKANVEEDVKWELNGGTVTVTLPSKIEGSAYTLPTPVKEGYVFLGWYDNAAGTGTALTSLPVGYKGTVYALWREAKVVWVLNGGKVYEEKTTTTGGTSATVEVPTNDSLWAAFKPYYNTYYNLNRADQTIENVASFAAAKMYEILTDEKSEYKWLGDYILSVATAQGYTLGEEEANWRWHADSFFNCRQRTSWPATADFTTAGKPEAWGPAYVAAHGGTTTGGTTTTTKVEVTLPSKITGAPYTIPTPEKENATFVGWYDTNDTTGTKLTVLPVGYDGTVYAIWKENGPTTGVENIRPALDMDAPMYDVLGRRVDATYRGIIIQNGNKYLLR